MKNNKIKTYVELIRQAFSYVKQYKGKTFVIRIDSEIILHPYFSVLLRDLTLLHQIGIKIVLVPGARKHINDILSKFKITWQVIDGVRVSSEESIPFIKMAAFDVSNKIMTLLAENQTSAVIGNWVRARSIGIRQGVDYKCTGFVDKIQIETVRNVLDQGMVTIFPNIGWNKQGKPYNISSSELAARLSQDLNAEKLFFVGDALTVSPGEYSLPESIDYITEQRVPKLTVEEAEQFIRLNGSHENTNLIELLTLGYQSCLGGVNRVHLLNGNVEGVVLKEIFSNEGVGTMIYANEHINIRSMTHSDIPEVLRIMQPMVEKDILIPRSHKLLEDRSDDFIVYEVDNNIHACGALHAWPENMGEIAGIVVDESYGNIGIGKKIVSFLLDKARRLGMKQVIVLTTQTTDWFSQMGFKRGEFSLLPNQRKQLYNQQRKSAIYVYDIAP